MMKTVYVLQSVRFAEKYYVGISEDVHRRLSEHNAGECIHTSKWKPWNLSVWITFVDDRKAHKFERYLKSGSGRAFSKRHF